MNIIFISAQPHTTLSLKVEYNVNTDQEELDRLTKALAEIEWEKSEIEAPPLPDGAHSATYTRAGSFFFGLWEDDEFVSFAQQAVNTLRELGYTNMPWEKLTWHDCI